MPETQKVRNVESLEKIQRQFVRYIMGFDRTSRTEATTSVLGLLSVSSYIDKHRLMFSQSIMFLGCGFIT